MAPPAVMAVLLLVLQFWGALSSLHEDRLEHHLDSEHDMDVLLGEKDSEELKKLSPEEQRKKMMDIVKKIDTNADNKLSAEITLWIQHVYRKYALDDAEERFPEFDANRDGVVTWEEYNLAELFSFDESTVVDDAEQESLRHLHLKERRRFDFADVDGTPGLNVTEFLAFTHPSEVDHMADFAIEDVLSEYDTDQDGLISLKEFIGDLRRDEDAPSQWEVEETVRFKDLYDQDKDGKLNREEQLRWIAPNSYGSAREEALYLIKEMDRDEDGQISEAEVLKNQETFMNSEVTDYGRHLHSSHDEL
ncbi:reticulocalbin-2 isoform X2 [Dunckerocampus dactyliophorus]|uniref:reticulocalbin-2 isoform X2 n=1 Tax=Dunckerocampus dactyliophorus TaxID=161453 RepID=UPI00240765C2|nr:reticulocalbin-2 isoform X2 [Dunckerocampus dactyliophorus]